MERIVMVICNTQFLASLKYFHKQFSLEYYLKKTFHCINKMHIGGINTKQINE